MKKPPEPELRALEARLSRRALLSAAGLGAGALLGLPGCDGAQPHAGFFGAMERFNQRVQSGLFRPEHRAEDPGPRAVTPDAAFPVYFVGGAVPTLPKGWTLRVGGMVARPLSLSLDDLRRFTRTDIRVRHHCVEGWSAVASWHGVALREIARVAGADRRATVVDFRSFDADYASSWDLESALHPQTLLAYGMNGRDLSPAHGAPVRVYGGVKLGYKNVKYLTEVNFLPARVGAGGYWEARGYEWFGGT